MYRIQPPVKAVVASLDGLSSADLRLGLSSGIARRPQASRLSTDPARGANFQFHPHAQKADGAVVPGALGAGDDPRGGPHVGDAAGVWCQCRSG